MDLVCLIGGELALRAGLPYFVKIAVDVFSGLSKLSLNMNGLAPYPLEYMWAEVLDVW